MIGLRRIRVLKLDLVLVNLLIRVLAIPSLDYIVNLNVLGRVVSNVRLCRRRILLGLLWFGLLSLY